MEDTSENTRLSNQICLGLVAHVDSGKTTLAESILFQSGRIRTMGRVDHKDAFLDTYELEKSRGITIFSKQAVLEFPETRVTIYNEQGVKVANELLGDRTCQAIIQKNNLPNGLYVIVLRNGDKRKVIKYLY